MSHYAVMVAVDPRPKASTELVTTIRRADIVEQRLEEALAPFDEDTETEPYREYEEGEPGDFWFVNHLKKSAQNVQDGTGILPYKPDEIGWSSASSKETPEVQRRKLEEEAARWFVLPAEPTWADVVALYQDEYPESDLKVSEDGRAYTMSRYPKKVFNDAGFLVSGPRWDWYSVGGRWQNALRIKPAFVNEEHNILHGRSGVMGTQRNPDGAYVADGAPKAYLDFEGMRALAEAKARDLYAQYHAAVEGTPEAKPWSWYVEQVNKELITIGEARELFHGQPRVVALGRHDTFKWDRGESITEYERPLDVVVQEARDRAIPMYSFLTLDGEWHEPGQMGWFGISSDTPETMADHYRWANEYIDSLDDEVYLILVDVHI